MASRWPERLWIVRHGESAGNVARGLADAAGLGRIDIAERDVDVPLSKLGEEQSCALGRWFAKLPEHESPEVVLTSTYLRALKTADINSKSSRIRSNVTLLNAAKTRRMTIRSEKRRATQMVRASRVKSVFGG